MKIIRINWKGFSKTCYFFVFGLIGIKLLYDYIFQPGLSSLGYDIEKREFYTNTLLAEFGNKSFESLDSSKERKLLRLKAAKFPYHRIHFKRWLNSLNQVVQLGFNTVDIDILWSIHEPTPNKFDFSHGSRDIDEFIKLANYFGLFVLVRLDPFYHCSEYDLGGLPSWMLADKNITNNMSVKNSIFQQKLQNFLNKLLPILSRHQVANGGPIIGFVTQFYTNLPNTGAIFSLYDAEYLRFVRSMFYQHGVFEIILKSVGVCDLDRIIDHLGFRQYCDPNFHVYLPIEINSGAVPVVRNTCFGEDLRKYWLVNASETGSYNEKHDVYLLKFKHNLESLLSSSKSFLIENFFYSSDFEMLRGAHLDQSTSTFIPIANNEFAIQFRYLVDADTSETTLKYTLASRVINREGAVESTADRSTDRNENIEFTIKMTHYMPFSNILSNFFTNLQIENKTESVSMEEISFKFNIKSSNKGYILYTHQVELHKDDQIHLNLNKIRDYALVSCDSITPLKIIDHRLKQDNRATIKLNSTCQRIEILVENMGRRSDLTLLSEFEMQRKGLLSLDAVELETKNGSSFSLKNWRVHFIDFSDEFMGHFSFGSKYASLKENCLTKSGLPAFFYSRFLARKKSRNTGVYLMMENFVKGSVMLNGYSLGKYWTQSGGPLLTMFVPADFIFDGINELIVFDIHAHNCEPFVWVTSHHVLRASQ